MRNILKIVQLLFVFVLCSCAENIIDLDAESDDVKGVPQDIINPEYVAIDWSKTHLLENDTVTGRVVVSLNDDTRKLKEGSVFTIIDPDKPGVKVVSNIKNSNDKIELQTIKGNLTDIFANVEFELVCSPGAQSRASNSAETIAPYAVAMTDASGNTQWVKTSIGTEEDIELKLFDNSGMEVASWGPDAKIWFSELKSSLKMSYGIRFNFGLRREYFQQDKDKVIKMYRSRMLKCESTASVGFGADMVLEGQIKGKKEIRPEDEIQWHKNIPTPGMRPILFMVMGVPVEITPKVDMMRGSEMTFEGEASFKAVARLNTNYSIKASWDMSKDDPYSFSSDYQEPTISYDGTSVSAKAHANVRLWYYPSIKFYFYDIVGPVIDIKPYIGVDANGGFKLSVGDHGDDYCGSQWATLFGIDARADIAISSWGYETDRWFKTEFKNICEFDLYRSPINIKFASATPNKVEPGRTMVVNFDVMDKALLWECPSKFPIVVRFTGNGKLEQEYVLTESGQAHAIWTPDSEDDKLTATIYDGYGKVIAYDVFNGEKKESLNLLSIGDAVFFKYDELGRIVNYQDSEGEYEFQYDSDGLQSIVLKDDYEMIIVTDLVFTQDGYIKSFREVGDDNFSGQGTVEYDEEGHPKKLILKDSDGFYATSNWEWQDGNLIKMTYSNNEGMNETVKYSYTSQENPLNMWSLATAGNSMGFLIFTNYLGKGSDRLPDSVNFELSDDGDKVVGEVDVACGLNSDGSIRKEVIRSGNDILYQFEYVYGSEMDFKGSYRSQKKYKGTDGDFRKYFFGKKKRY